MTLVANIPVPKLDLWVDVDDSLAGMADATSHLPDHPTWQLWFGTWLQELAPTASPISSYELSLRFVDDDAIRQLNAAYRHQDKSTDVLAFAAQEAHMPGAQAIYQEIPLPLGDVIISVETAQRQCQEHGHALKEELAWLVAHGLLHLLGWDHPDEDSLQAMWAKQRSLLASTGIALADSAYLVES